MKCLLSGLGLIYLSYVFFTGSWGNFVYQPYKEYNEAMIGLSRDMDIDKFIEMYLVSDVSRKLETGNNTNVSVKKVYE